MTRSRARRTALVMMMVAGMLAAVSVLFAGAASAQEVACPAGARGGAGGNAGRSTGGNGGLGFTVGGLASQWTQVQEAFGEEIDGDTECGACDNCVQRKADPMAKTMRLLCL